MTDGAVKVQSLLQKFLWHGIMQPAWRSRWIVDFNSPNFRAVSPFLRPHPCLTSSQAESSKGASPTVLHWVPCPSSSVAALSGTPHFISPTLQGMLQSPRDEITLIWMQIRYQKSPISSSILKRKIPSATFSGQTGKWGINPGAAEHRIWLYLLM